MAAETVVANSHTTGHAEARTMNLHAQDGVVMKCSGCRQTAGRGRGGGGVADGPRDTGVATRTDARSPRTSATPARPSRSPPTWTQTPQCRASECWPRCSPRQTSGTAARTPGTGQRTPSAPPLPSAARNRGSHRGTAGAPRPNPLKMRVCAHRAGAPGHTPPRSAKRRALSRLPTCVAMFAVAMWPSALQVSGLGLARSARRILLAASGEAADTTVALRAARRRTHARMGKRGIQLVFY